MGANLILVVADTDPTLTLLHQVLVHLGYSVVLASNGREAAGQLNRHRPDLVLLDVGMENEQVGETLRGLKLRGNDSDPPLIALAQSAAAEEALDHDFAGVVRKPIVLPTLAAVLDQALERRAARRRESSAPTAAPDPLAPV